ncbi:MAG: PAS domain S-box protein [Chitinivibrionales bacterium]|nr:PAS domain S-box protein [Chitinivibrionales bacterium]
MGDGIHAIGRGAFNDRDKMAYMESIIDSAHEALVVLDDTMHVVSANRYFFLKFQVSPEETEGRVIYELGNGQWNISQLRELLETIIPRQAVVDNFEVRHRFEHIGEKVMLLNARRMIREEGKPALILLAIEDITEQYNAQRKLEQSESLYRKFVEEGNSIIIGFDRKGRITFFNRFSEKIFGYERNDLLGMPLIGTIIPTVDSRGNNNSTILRDIFAHPKRYYSQESEGMCKDGRRVWFSWSARAIDDDSGTPVEILIDGNDITELAATRRQLEEKSATLDVLLDFIPEGILITDSDHRVQNASRRMAELFGVPVEKLLHTSDTARLDMLELYLPDGERVCAQDLPLAKAIITGKAYADFEIMLKRNGSTVMFSVNAAPVRDSEGNVTGAIGGWRDVTKIKKAERILRENETLLASILEQLPLGIGVLDQEGRFILSNSITREFGLERYMPSRDPELKELWLAIDDEGRLLPPEQWPDARALRGETVRPGVEFVYTSRTGEDQWVKISAVPFRCDKKEISGAIFVAEDITARKRVEAERENLLNQIATERQRLDTILRRLPAGVMIAVAPSGEIIYTNEYAQNLFGPEYPHDGIEHYINGWKPYHSDGSPYPLEDIPLTRALRGQTTTGREMRFKHKSGTGWIDTEVSGAPIMDAEGNIVEGVITLMDITERKRIEDELQQKTAQLEATINSIPHGYVVYSTDGTILRMNDIAKEMSGFSEADFYKDSAQRLQLFRVFSPDGEPIPLEQIPVRRAFKGETVRNEIMRVRPRANHDFWLSVSASPIIEQDTGISGAVMAFVDISPLHELQERLADERNFMDAVLQTSGALIMVIHKNGKIVRCNRACEQSTGFSADEINNHSLSELLSGEERKKNDKVVERLFAGESIVENEIYWLTKSGEQRFIRWRNSAMYDDNGNPEYIIATGFDITERKDLEEELNRRAEQLATANRDLESFSYSVSHDLRNPLQTITAYTSLLEEVYTDQISKECMEHLKHIDVEVEKMGRLIDDMLNLSRIGKQEMNRKDVNLSNIVRTSLKEFGISQSDRKAEFVVQDDLHANADKRLISLAIENLLRNAWKFTSKRETTRIEFGATAHDGEAVFFIRDNGAGFDMQFAQTIFEPFKRVHKEKEYHGTGVGLSIVQRVINRHGGRIWAEGEEDKGAVFYFTLG